MKLLKISLHAGVMAVAWCGSNAWAAPAPDWWHDAVFYQAYVRSFYDASGNGVGDFKGLTAKLDYLNDGNPATKTDLGITAIWLMPISQSGTVHGYDVENYRSFEQDYGNRADFEEFVTKAHARGIKVIIDWVMNHSSNRNPWFTQSASSAASPFRKWYRWSATVPAGEQYWHKHANGSYYYGHFGNDMPDLNYSDPDLKQEMFRASAFWLDTIKVDGFRLDAIRLLFEEGKTIHHVLATFEFLKEFRTFYKGVNPEAVAVGEVWDRTQSVARYVDGDKLDLCFEFDLAEAILSGVKNGSADPIRNKMAGIAAAYPNSQYGTFLRNHDQSRTMTVLEGNIANGKLAASLLLTLTGVPFIYYGEEIAAQATTVGEARHPMAWTNGHQAGFTTGTAWHTITPRPPGHDVQSLQGDNNSIWHHYRKLIQARLASSALKRGRYKDVISGSTAVLAFQRGSGPGSVVVVLNLSGADVTNYALNGSVTGLQSGSPAVKELMDLGPATGPGIETDGGFKDWKPVATLKARTTYLFQIGEPGPIGVLPRAKAIDAPSRTRTVSPLGQSLPKSKAAASAVLFPAR